MSVSTAQFLERLESSGILGDDEFRLVVDAAESLDGDSDATEFAGGLVEKGRLTDYQVRRLVADEGHELVLGNYVVEGELGRGGMGVVLKARHRRMKRHVAIKVLPAAVSENPDAIARFHREVEAAARLSHPNIVTAYDADEVDGRHFLAMEFVDGRDLSTLLRSRGPFPPATAVDFVLQAARGLEYAHGKGVVHRDVKPANLLLGRDGVVQILDMGLARFEAEHGVDSRAELTGTGAVLGTIDYMSPEQAESTRDADARSDVYSLGCTLFSLLTGRPTYGGDSMVARIVAHRERPIPSLVDANPLVPPSLDATFRQMVAKNPAERYQSMREVIAVLESVVDDQPDTFARTEASRGGLSVSDSGTTAFVPRDEAAALAASATVIAADLADPGGDTLTGTPEERTRLSNSNVATARSPSRRTATIAASALLGLGLVAFGVWWANGGGTEAVVERPPGGPNLALEFDGVDDYVEIPMSGVDLGDEYTIEAWVETSKAGGPSSPVWDWRADRHARLSTTIAPDRWEAYSSVSGLAGGAIAARTTERTHIAFVVRRQGFRLFVNGELASMGLHATNPNSVFERDSILRLAAGRARFAGQLDELRISNTPRYVASAERDFTPSTRFEPDEHTIALFHFDEGSGTKLLDASGNGHHGTIHGNPKLVPAGVSPRSADEAATVAADRRAAEYVLSLGGKVRVNDGVLDIRDVRDLPADPFRLTGAILYKITTTTDAGLASFEGCRHLRTLNLTGPNVTDAGLRHFRECRDLERLDLGEVPLTDEGLAVFEPNQRLRILYLIGSRVTSEGLARLESWPELREFHFMGTRVADGGLAPLRGREKITVLKLYDTRLSDSELASLAGCRNLEVLSIEKNPISDAGLRPFLGHAKLTSLDVRQTKVSPQLVAEFHERLPHCRIISDGGVVEPTTTE